MHVYPCCILPACVIPCILPVLCTLYLINWCYECYLSCVLYPTCICVLNRTCIMQVVYYLHMPCEPFRKARWNPGDEVCQCNVPVACVRHCRYYSQASVLDKVPPCLLLLGVVQTSVQLLATLLIRRPTPPQVSALVSGWRARSA